MKLNETPQDLIDDFGVVVKYYAGYLCSCTAQNNGAYDPTCGCLGGFRYHSPVEYRLISTNIRIDRITERSGQIFEGGRQFTIPYYLDQNNAQITGKVDLSAGVDLSTEYNLKVAIDEAEAATINCKAGAVDPDDVKIQTIIQNINEALGDNYAFETDSEGKYGTGYITIKSLTAGKSSKVRVLKPAANDGTFEILGLNENTYPYDYTWSNSGRIYLPLYHSISVGDVFVMKNRYFRDAAICKKGVNDIIKAFDVDSILSVTQKDTIYKPGIDYSVSGNTITWIEGGSAPENQTYYSVEHRLPLQYVLFRDMGSDRGGDDDQPAKKVMVALRNYINAQSLTIDNLGE